MKLRYLWKITLDNEWKQGIRSFFNVILYIVGITIIGLLVYFVSLETDTKKSVERSIRKEIKTLGSISVEGNPSDIQYNSNFDLLKVVKSFSGIDACSSGWGNDCKIYKKRMFMIPDMQYRGKVWKLPGWTLERGI